MADNDTDEPLECVRRYVVNSNANTTSYYFYAGYSGIPENLVLNIIVWLILFAAFLIVRWIRIYRDDSKNEENQVLLFGLFEYIQAIFGWIPELFRAGDEEFHARCGWDAVIYLRFQRYLMILTAVVGVASLAIALPVNFLDDLVSDFGKTTIANIEGNSLLLWIHVVLAALYLLGTILLMQRFTNLYVKAGRPKETNRTLILSHVPTTQVTRAEIHEYFRDRFSDAKVESINFAYNVKYVNNLNEKRRYVQKTREEASLMQTTSGVTDMMKPYPCACFCCCCPKCQRRPTVERCDEEGRELQALFEKHIGKVLESPLDLVFVTFYTENMAVRVYNSFNVVWRMRCVCRARCCPQAGLDGRNWVVYYSPPPDDIYWHNLAATDLWWWLKAAILNLGLMFFLFLFTTPAVFMNLLDEWRYKDALNAINDKKSMGLSPLIVNVIPVLLLCTFSSLLPLIVLFSEVLIGHWRRTIEEKLIMQKTYSLLLLMILILPSLGLTSAKAMLMWLADQKGAARHFRWKCVFLPDNGAFFVNYVITATFMGTAIQLLRIGDFIVFSFRLLLSRSAAQRQLIRKMEGMPFPFGQQYAWVGCIMGVVMSYSVICPLVVPFGKAHSAIMAGCFDPHVPLLVPFTSRCTGCLVYLVMKHLVDRHNLYYVARPVRLGGEVHERAVNFVLAGVILLQVWMIVFTAIRSDTLPPTSIFALIVLLLALTYLTGNAVYSWVRHQVARMKLVFTTEDVAAENEGGESAPLETAVQYQYVPDVLLAGSANPAAIVSRFPVASSQA